MILRLPINVDKQIDVISIGTIDDILNAYGEKIANEIIEIYGYNEKTLYMLTRYKDNEYNITVLGSVLGCALS